MRWSAPLVLLSLLLVVGCGKGNFSQQANAGKANVFRYPITASPTTLDPALVQDGDTIDLLQQVFEGLTTWGENNEVTPNLAERWELGPDKRTYTFYIKKGVKFHNSDREVKAADFKYSIERALDPALKSTTAGGYLSDIVGVQDVLSGKSKEVSGIKVVDDYTLTIQIDKPRAYFLGKLTYPASFVVNPDVAKMGQEITSVEAMSGTGPFVAEKYTTDQQFDLVANADYHNGDPLVERIERPVIGDQQTRLNRYRSGELDMIRLERQDIAAIQGDAELKDHLVFFNRPSTYYVGLNSKMYEPFADRRVRRAFAMAINRDRIVKEILGGVNPAANSIVPPGVMGHRESAASIPYDPEGAKKLLSEAGWGPGKKALPPLDFFYRSEQKDVTMVAEAVQQDLQENLGVRINAKPTAWTAYLDKNNKKQLPMFHMRWAADYLDPQNFLSYMLTTNGPENKLYYSNPEFDRLCEQADTSDDREERLRLYAQAEDIALQDAPWVPIYFQKDAELINPRVQGLRESLFGHLPHTKVTLAAAK